MSDPAPLAYPDARAALAAVLTVLPMILDAADIDATDTRIDVAAVSEASGDRRTLRSISLREIIDAATATLGSGAGPVDPTGAGA